MTTVQNAINKIVFALFLVVVFSLGFMKPSVEFRNVALAPTEIVFLFALLMCVVGLVSGVIRFRWHPAFWAFAFYLGALLVSAIFSVKPSLSFVKFAGVVYLVLLAMMTAILVTDVGKLRLFLFAWLGGAVVPLLIALVGIVVFYVSPDTSLLQHITYHYGAVPVGNFPRISSTFVSPSMFCNYLTVTLLLALVAKRMGWIANNVATLLVIAIVVAAIFTVSIALGGVILSVGLWFWYTDRETLLSKSALAAGITGAVAFLMASIFSLPTLLTPPLAPSSRVLVWADAMKTFLADPLTGKGVGTGAASVQFQNFDGTWSLLTDAHNSFLNVAAESGVLGLAGLVGVVVVLWRAANKDAGQLKFVRSGLWIAFAVAFVYEGLTGSYEDARHLWVLMGVILATEGSKFQG